MRAGYTAIVLGLVGGVLAATALLSAVAAQPVTVARALGLDGPDPPGLATRRAAAVAVLIATCMTDLGQEWDPVPEPTPFLPDAELDPEAWAARWGFGVSTAAGMPATPVVADPNAARLASLTPVDRTVYTAALHGTSGRPGCQPAATATVYGLRDRLTAPLRSDLAALQAAIDADPAMTRARDAWAACAATLTGGRPPDRTTLTASLVRSFVERASTEADPSARASLQAEERRVATILAGCEVDFATARTGVAARHEAAFVAAHAAALKAIAAAIRAAEAALPTLPPPAPPDP